MARQPLSTAIEQLNSPPCISTGIPFLPPAALNDYVNDPEKAAKAFNECLDDSYREEIPPKAGRKHTDVYLGATAGMRLVKLVQLFVIVGCLACE